MRLSTSSAPPPPPPPPELGAAVTVTWAVDDCPGSATETAETVTIAGVGTFAGGM